MQPISLHAATSSSACLGAGCAARSRGRARAGAAQRPPCRPPPGARLQGKWRESKGSLLLTVGQHLGMGRPSCCKRANVTEASNRDCAATPTRSVAAQHCAAAEQGRPHASHRRLHRRRITAVHVGDGFIQAGACGGKGGATGVAVRAALARSESGPGQQRERRFIAAGGTPSRASCQSKLFICFNCYRTRHARQVLHVGRAARNHGAAGLEGAADALQHLQGRHREATCGAG